MSLLEDRGRERSESWGPGGVDDGAHQGASDACREGDTPSRTLPEWRYPMEIRFTFLVQDVAIDTWEVRAPVRIYRRFGDLFGTTSLFTRLSLFRERAGRGSPGSRSSPLPATDPSPLQVKRPAFMLRLD